VLSSDTPVAPPPTPSDDATSPLPPPGSTEPLESPPPELTDPAADTWSQPPVVPIPEQPTFVPPPVLPPPAPPSGRGLLIAATVVGGAGLIVRVLTTIQVSRASHIPGGLPFDTMIRGAVFYDPLIAAGLGLAGGGMARRGRYDAHGELFEGTTPTRARRKKLGWALFGAGLGTWAVTRIAGGTSCRDNDFCKARVWEWGYYASLAGTIPGAILGGYASGYEGYNRRFGHLADVGLAPIANRQTQTWGMALSGRF